MRRIALLLVFVAACSPAGVGSTSTGDTASSQTSPPPDETTTTLDEPTTDPTEGVDSTTTTDSGRPVAPDFTLALGEGGTYTLSEGEKPVYMVFWAEW